MTTTPTTSKPAWRRFAFTVARKFKNSGFALVEQGTQSALNFITMLLISKFCGLEALGFYATGRFLMLLFGGIQNSLVSFPYTIYFRNQESNTASYARHHFVMCSWLSLLTGFFFVVSAVATSELSSVCWALSFATPMYLVREFSRRHEFAHLRTQAAMWFSISVAAMQLIGLFVLWRYSMLTVSSAFVLMGASCLVTNVGWLCVRAGEFLITDSIKTSTTVKADASAIVNARETTASLLRKNWVVGKWMFSTQTLTDLLILAIQSLLVFLVDPKAGGVFAACFAVVSLCNPIVRGLSNLLTPEFAKTFANGSFEVLYQSVVDATKRFVGLLVVLGLGIVIFGKFLVVLFYDKPIDNLTHTLAVLALAMLVQAAGLPAFHALNVVSQPYRAFLPRVAGVALAALFLATCGFLMRELGAAYGLLIANLAISLFTFHQFLLASQKTDISKSTLASI